MTQKKYKEARKNYNIELAEKKRKQDRDKENLVEKHLIQQSVINFVIRDDLFDLVQAMRIGAEILEREGFPLKEYVKFKCNHRKNAKKKSKDR